MSHERKVFEDLEKKIKSRAFKLLHNAVDKVADDTRRNFKMDKPEPTVTVDEKEQTVTFKIVVPDNVKIANDNNIKAKLANMVSMAAKKR